MVEEVPKFNQGDAERVWDVDGPPEDPFRTVFHEAQNNWDWTNPRSRQTDAWSPRTTTRPIAPARPPARRGSNRSRGPGPLPDRVCPGRFHSSCGLSHRRRLGRGKVDEPHPPPRIRRSPPPKDWGFHPDLRRHVIWLSEAPEQAGTRSTPWRRPRAQRPGTSSRSGSISTHRSA
jgi:hypothetical protein